MKTVSYWFNIFKDLIINNERTKIETFMDCTKKNALEGMVVIINFNRMDNFIVSARKYRPESFNTVVGQATITGTLKAAIQKKQLGHAYLFCGPRGVGKTTVARILAKTINCMQPGTDAEPCNACESCISFNESRAFNIHELDAASNNSVDDIRNLTEQIRIPPQIGRYSIYIIDEVHMLSASAFNAFLKTLEEPPSHAVFILATTEKHKIIPTILSRCQIYDFNRIRVEDIVGYLEFISDKEGVEYEKDAFSLIALKADGAMRDALSIYDQMVSYSGKSIRYQDVIENLNILDYEYYFRCTESCFSGNTGETLMIFDEVLSKGFDAHNFLSGFSSHLRDLLVCLDEATLKLLEVGAGIREKYKAQSKTVDQQWLYEALDILGTADVSFKTSRNQRLHVELALLKLCRIREQPKKKELTRGTEPETTEKPAEPASAEPASAEPVADKDPAEPGPVADTSSGPKETIPPAEADTGEDSAETIPPAEADTGEDPKETVPPTQADPGSAEPGPGPPVSRSSRQVPGSIPSIKGVLNGDRPKEEKKDAGKDPAERPVLSSSFSQEDLLKHWEEFTDSIMGKKPRMANSLKHHLPVLGDALQIELVLSNSAQLEEFNRDIKPALVNYLEEALQNNQFKLLPVVSEEDQPQNTLYTSEEKFKHMLKKNPDLGKMKERFNLDFE
jgi:DNA polymerase-3 subunit gamma/tau